MDRVDVLVVIVVLAWCLLPLARWLGYRAGRREEREALVKAETFRDALVDEDGCWTAVWKDGRSPGLVANQVPSKSSRKTARDIAQKILERQGEEGAAVALEVIAKYRTRETPRTS